MISLLETSSAVIVEQASTLTENQHSISGCKVV